MNLDAQELRKALFDLFKANPKDFFVSGSASSFNIRLARPQGSGSQITNIHGILSYQQYLRGTYGVQSTPVSFADALTFIDANKVGVDTNCATSFNLALANSSFSPATVQSRNFPLLLPQSQKTNNIGASGGGLYQGFVTEDKYENFLFLSCVNTSSLFGAIRFQISYKVTQRVAHNGSTTDTVLNTGSFNTPSTVTGNIMVPLSPYPDIISQSWATDPVAANMPNFVSLLYQITNIAIVF